MDSTSGGLLAKRYDQGWRVNHTEEFAAFQREMKRLAGVRPLPPKRGRPTLAEVYGVVDASREQLETDASCDATLAVKTRVGRLTDEQVQALPEPCFLAYQKAVLESYDGPTRDAEGWVPPEWDQWLRENDPIYQRRPNLLAITPTITEWRQELRAATCDYAAEAAATTTVDADEIVKRQRRGK